MIDTIDAHLAPAIDGAEVLVGDTMMRNAEDRRRVATEVLAFARGLTRR
jgi:hypothetical protein